VVLQIAVYQFFK